MLYKLNKNNLIHQVLMYRRMSKNCANFLAVLGFPTEEMMERWYNRELTCSHREWCVNHRGVTNG